MPLTTWTPLPSLMAFSMAGLRPIPSGVTSTICTAARLSHVRQLADHQRDVGEDVILPAGVDGDVAVQVLVG